LISDVEKKCACTESGVEAAVGIAKERKPTNGCVPDPRGSTEKGLVSFRCVEPWIATVRWWNDRLCHRLKRESNECERDGDEWLDAGFHAKSVRTISKGCRDENAQVATTASPCKEDNCVNSSQTDVVDQTGLAEENGQ
jgi:hypothetical protein